MAVACDVTCNVESCSWRCENKLLQPCMYAKPRRHWPEWHANGVFAQRRYHKMAPCTACTVKMSQALLQVQEDDQSSLPMSLVASLDTVPVTCCVRKTEKRCKNLQGSDAWDVNPYHLSHVLEKCTHTHTHPAYQGIPIGVRPMVQNARMVHYIIMWGPWPG